MLRWAGDYNCGPSLPFREMNHREHHSCVRGHVGIRGPFDEEFQTVSSRFFDQVRSGRFKLVTSALVQEEIEPAPIQVRDLFDELLDIVDVVDVSEDALNLREAYLERGIVSPQWADDALHVAVATVAGCSLIVSWNFKHIVHFEKIPLYNAINTLKGYANYRNIFSFGGCPI